MSCKDCQCTKTIDKTLTDLNLTEEKQSRNKCSSCDASQPSETGCSCCRPPAPRRNCRCCPCRSCCSCCSCCSPRPDVCSGRKGCGREEEKPKQVVETCECCAAEREVKPKKVCAGCGCDKCA